MPNSRFWRYSVRLYAQRGVANACLRLQDEYAVDVNVLLFTLFVAQHGRRLSRAEARAVQTFARQWRINVVEPLRTLRRKLKTGIAPVKRPASNPLRAAVKDCELLAEELQQRVIERRFPLQSIGKPAPVKCATAANLAAFFPTLRVSRHAQLRRLQTAAEATPRQR